MEVTLHGAAGGEVTGSAYHIRAAGANLLLDCGLFQGGRRAFHLNRLPPAIDAKNLDAVLLTHAHLDHTGRLPLLWKAGFRHPIHATPATIDITELILRDSAKVQAQDTDRYNRKRLRVGEVPLEPLYTGEEVGQTMRLFQSVPYDEPVPIVPGITARFAEAGHMLGSTSIQLRVEENGRTQTVVFSGDLGPRDMPVLRDAQPFSEADAVFLESTYGDRDHKSFTSTVEEFLQIVEQAVARKGKILVPTFAVGRAQLMLVLLAWGFRKKRFPPFPVFVDSPMALEATRIHERHPELYDEEMQRFLAEGDIYQDLAQVRATPTPDESKAINDVTGPCLVLAGAGMCNAGRILHHLRHNLRNPATTIIIVGYQVEGSLGRQLVDGMKTVSLLGERIPVKAKVHTLGGFSGHAGQTELLAWLGAMVKAKPRVILTHGEDRARIPLARLIEERYGLSPVLADIGQTIRID